MYKNLNLLQEAISSALQGKLEEDYIFITQKNGYKLFGDKEGYHISDINGNIIRDLGNITKEQAIVDFDDYVND